jgi:hypothetical protein
MSGKFFDNKDLVQLDNGANRQTINTDKYCEYWFRLDEPASVEGFVPGVSKHFKYACHVPNVGQFYMDKKIRNILSEAQLESCGFQINSKHNKHGKQISRTVSKGDKSYTFLKHNQLCFGSLEAFMDTFSNPQIHAVTRSQTRSSNQQKDNNDDKNSTPNVEQSDSESTTHPANQSDSPISDQTQSGGEHFTKKEVKRAKQVIELHRSMNHPNDNALTTLLDQGGIQGCYLTGID